MLQPAFLQIPKAPAQLNVLQSLSFNIYQWLPRLLPYTPNPLFLNHIARDYQSLAWHSDFRVHFPHTLQYRMLKAITSNDLQQVAKILKNPKFLIDQPIDKKYGLNALQFSAMINQFTVVELLLMYGANINKKDKHGNTPLMYAVDRHNLESINSLMKNGCNRREKNNYGVDPVEKAKLKPNQGYLVEFLENYPQTQRKFPKFKVRLNIEDRLNNPFWEYLKNYKIYDSKPKIYPFNNFKGSYRVDFSSYQTIQEIITKRKQQSQSKVIQQQKPTTKK